MMLATMSPTRTGVLLIRVWLEEEPPVLRARITRKRDATARRATVTFTADAAVVTGEVQAWLAEFLGEAPP
jgi:hypothetical protein